MSTLLDGGLGSVERFFGSRFVIAVLLPLTLVGAVSAPVVLTLSGRSFDAVLDAWHRHGTLGQAVIALAGLLSLAVAGYLLSFFQLPALRLLEGYWSPAGPLAALGRRRTEHHRRLATDGWRQVAADPAARSALAVRLQTDYPPRSRLAAGCLPTAFGNRLRAAEYYPLERYGVDTAVIWPRLHPLLPEDCRTRLADARSALDCVASLVVLAAAFGTLWPVLLVLDGGRFGPAAWCLLGWPAAWVGYRVLLQVAVSYGQEIKVAVDLHRRALLKHLELDAAAPDLAAERVLWDALAQFYLRNLPFEVPQLPSPVT
ncbi:hypothetical protein [Kitasatospora griseola]|uniref:hypothetical protein n=1 Tax=Kitasatospora griseola TaxID=2064 RepID=UPI0038244A40